MTTSPRLSAQVVVEWSPTTAPFATPVWATIENDANGNGGWRSIQISRGRQHELDQFSAGKATIVLDNRDRRFDPLHTTGPHYGNLKPRKRIRISAIYGATTYRLFSGFIDGWPQEYEPPNDAFVTLTATDGFGLLATFDVPSVWEQVVTPLGAYRWYRLGEQTGDEAGDSSGNEAHATYVGGATFNSRRSLIVGDSDPSIFFDKGQYVDLDTAVPGAYPFTIVTVFHSPSVGDTWNARYVFQYRTTSGPVNQFDARIVNSGGVDPGHLVVRIINNSSDSRTLTSDARIDDGGVYSLIISATSASSVAVYLNGVALTDITTSGTGTPAIGPYDTAAIGNDVSSGAGAELPMLGEVDEFLIFTSALSSGQAATLHAAALAPWDEDTPADRLGAILDYVGWPAGDRALDTGVALLGPAELETKALDHLYDVAAAEGGRALLYINGNSVVSFVGRQEFRTEPVYTVSNATFGDDIPGGDLPYSVRGGFRLAHDEDEVINRARIAPATGFYAQADYAGRGANDPIRSHEERIIEKRAEYAQFAADYLVAEYGEPVPRLDRITIQPERAPALLYPVILAADFGYRYTVKRHPQSVGSAISLEVHLEHMDHTITPDSWVAEWQLSRAASQYWELGTTGASELGVSTHLGY